MFRTLPLSIIKSFHCTHSNDICHTGSLTVCEQDQDCPKHGEFYSKSKFEKLLRPVGVLQERK